MDSYREKKKHTKPQTKTNPPKQTEKSPRLHPKEKTKPRQNKPQQLRKPKQNTTQQLRKTQIFWTCISSRSKQQIKPPAETASSFSTAQQLRVCPFHALVMLLAESKSIPCEGSTGMGMLLCSHRNLLPVPSKAGTPPTCPENSSLGSAGEWSWQLAQQGPVRSSASSTQIWGTTLALLM